MSLLYEAAHQSFLPRLVSPAVLPQANARLQLSSFVAQTSGPLLGGSLIRFLGVPLSLLADALSYLTSAVLLATIRREEPAPAIRRLHLQTELREGLSWVYRHRVLAPYALTLHSHFLFESMASVVFTLLVLQGLEPGLSEKEAGFRLGLVLAVGGVGAVAGSSVSGAVGRLGMGRLLIVGRWLTVAGWMLAAVAVSSAAGWVLAAASQFVVWFAIGSSSPHELGYRQAVTPDRLQGRMNATIRSLNWGTLTVGAPVGGLLAQVLGYRGALWLAIGGMALTCLAVSLSPVRNARHPKLDHWNVT
jgi:predicted MFS family arabinose efflux permease